jgi:hypothetical protein
MSFGELLNCVPDTFVSSMQSSIRAGSKNFNPRSGPAGGSAAPMQPSASAPTLGQQSAEITALADTRPDGGGEMTQRRRVAEIEDLPEIPDPYEIMPIWQREVKLRLFLLASQKCASSSEWFSSSSLSVGRSLYRLSYRLLQELAWA